MSLFETNIRVLGGLLSAHQLAEAFIPVGSVAQSDVWDEEGNIRIGEPESAFKNKPSVDFVPMNTKQWQREEKMSATCSLDDPTRSPPPCTSFDFVEDIGRCTKIERGLNTTPSTKKKTKANDRSDSRKSHSKPWKYDGLFLTLAHDLGTRLLPGKYGSVIPAALPILQMIYIFLTLLFMLIFGVVSLLNISILRMK